MHLPTPIIAGFAVFAACLIGAGRLARGGLQALEATQKVALVDQLAKRRGASIWVSVALLAGYFAALTQFDNRRQALLGYFVLAGILVAIGFYRSGKALQDAGIVTERAKPFRVAALLRIAGLSALAAGVWLSLV